MVMAARRGNAEVDGDDIEERRIGQRDALHAEIVGATAKLSR